MILKVKYTIILILLAGLLLCFTRYSCQKSENNPVLAEVNGERIYLSDYNEFREILPERHRAVLDQDPKQLLNRLIIHRLVIHEARRRGILSKNQLVSLKQPDIARVANQLTRLELGEDFQNISEQEVDWFYRRHKKEFGGKKLSEVEGVIRRVLLVRKHVTVLNRLVQELYQKASINIFEENLPTGGSSLLVTSSKKEFLEAISSGRPTIANFGSHYCPPCVRLQPVLKSLRNKCEGRINIITIEVDKEKDLATQYGIRLIPTLIFFNAKGHEIYRSVGFVKQKAIEEKIKELNMCSDPLSS